MEIDQKLENEVIGKLLIVDDDAIIRNALESILGGVGYEIITAENGSEGVRQFKKGQPDLVLMDVMMPVMDGYEACRELRTLADFHKLPIILLTGLNDTESVDEAFNAGATDFITKPINWTLLAQRVRYALRGRRLYMDLQRQQSRLARAQRIAKIAYWEYFPTDSCFHCSKEFVDILGDFNYERINTLDAFLGLIKSEERIVVSEAINQLLFDGVTYSVDHRIRVENGEERIVQQQGKLIEDSDELRCIVGTIQDITERKHAESLIEYQNNYDSLTGLPNRNLFNQQLKEAMKASINNETLLAVIFLGLDQFKKINDILGHGIGDGVLKGIATRLCEFSGSKVKAGRFGGDVFALIVEDFRSVAELDEMLIEIIKLFDGPVVCEQNELFISSSMGVSLFPIDTSSEEELMTGADVAMHAAKSAGKNQYKYFTVDMNARARSHFEVEKELRQALDREQFEIFYQPQVLTTSGEVIGMEALIRWIHPQRGMVSPTDFIPVAEESGLIVPIGEWVLKQACKQTAQWTKEGLGALRVGINLSARQFSDSDLLALVRNVLGETGLVPAQLDLEVTESIAMRDFDASVATLSEIKTYGVTTSMDDFGTGYSSLSYLQRLPIDILKIDRAFIKNINEKGEHGAIARAMVSMGHGLGVTVIAEGVEKKHQYDFMAQYGCDEIQGAYFSKALPAQEFAAYVTQSRTTHSIVLG